MTMAGAYMLDTSVINHIIEDDTKVTVFQEKYAGSKFYISHIQIDELDKMKINYEGKHELAYAFLKRISVINIPTSVFCIGYIRLNYAQLSNGEFYNLVLNYINNQTFKNKKKDNKSDAIIADTAFSNNIPLITDDNDLYTSIILHGGIAYKLEQFMQLFMNDLSSINKLF